MTMEYGKELLNNTNLIKKRRSFMTIFKEKPSEILFQAVLIIIMILFCIMTLYPFIYLLSLSLTAPDSSKMGSGELYFGSEIRQSCPGL